MTRTVRRAEPRDLAAVREIVEAAYRPYVSRLGREPGPMLDDYAALIRQDRVHVADEDGVPLGLVVLVPEDDAMLLDNVAVAPAAQGKGLGGTLLDFAEETARQSGYRRIRLYTNEAMTENIALYARRGYVETHRAVEKGFRRVYMTKPLPRRPAVRLPNEKGPP